MSTDNYDSNNSRYHYKDENGNHEAGRDSEQTQWGDRNNFEQPKPKSTYDNPLGNIDWDEVKRNAARVGFQTTVVLNKGLSYVGRKLDEVSKK